MWAALGPETTQILLKAAHDGYNGDFNVKNVEGWDGLRNAGQQQLALI